MIQNAPLSPRSWFGFLALHTDALLRFPARRALGAVVLAMALHGSLLCGQSPVAPEDMDRQNYAPSRQVDLIHLKLDVTPDFAQRQVRGTATFRFKPIAFPLEELRLNGVDLRVSAVTGPALRHWEATRSEVVVTFASPLPVDREVEVVIQYEATPARGLYFRTPELGYKAEDSHLFSQGEAIESRHWYPSFDAPNEKFTSEMICHVPEGMVVLSNGRLMAQEKDPAGRVAVRWLQDQPHANYLIALAAGYFKKVEDRHGNLPLAFYTPASQIAQAGGSFAGTREMVDFFEQETGIPYPWPQYNQVCVDDFVAGGMENTTLTILTSHTLSTPDFETLRESEGLVAHELAHQWFGDLVTCKDWAHLWLNEGFATYYEALYTGHRHGRDEFLYHRYQSARSLASANPDNNAIVRRNFQNPDQQFTSLTYGKAAWVLHMLRCQLGEDLYRRCVRTFLERHRYGSVVTEDFSRIIEELSGRSFDRFFDQWIYHGGYPALDVDYQWDERAHLARLRVQQTQKVSDAVPLFHFPLPVRFLCPTGVLERTVFIRNASEDFYFPLPQAPERVRVDPELTVLANLRFHPPRAMLDRQLADPSDALGRLLAIEQLSGKSDALEALKNVLNRDPFYGNRQAAARGLRDIKGPAALKALLDSRAQPDARVRQEVLSAIGGFYEPQSRDALLEALQSEHNPDLRAQALRTLGAYTGTNVEHVLLQSLRSDSYRQVLAEAAIEGLRQQDNCAHAPVVLETLRERPAAFSTSFFTRGFDTLARLARTLENKDAFREYLLAQVNHPRESLALAAIGALGTLGDSRATAPLQLIARGPRSSPRRDAADRALAALRSKESPAAEPSAVRKELEEVRKENRELRQSFDELKKKVDALLGAATNPPTLSKPAKKSPPKASARGGAR